MARKGTVGIMTTTYGHSREDVRRWPDDPAVRRTLEEYLDKFPAGARTVESLLNDAPVTPRAPSCAARIFRDPSSRTPISVAPIFVRPGSASRHSPARTSG